MIVVQLTRQKKARRASLGTVEAVLGALLSEAPFTVAYFHQCREFHYVIAR